MSVFRWGRHDSVSASSDSRASTPFEGKCAGEARLPTTFSWESPESTSFSRESLGKGFDVCIAVNAVLLLVAQLTSGVRAEISGSAPSLDAGMEVPLGPRVLSIDNIPSAVTRLFEAHAWILAGALLLLSGVWPHVKLIATYFTVHLVCEGRMLKSQGHHALCVLEALGKYSFADIFMIAIYLACFTLVTPSYSILDTAELQVNIGIYLEVGVALLVLAIVASTAITFWAAHCLAERSGAGAEAQPLRSPRGSGATSTDSSWCKSTPEVSTISVRAEEGLGSAGSSGPAAALPAWRAVTAGLVACLALGTMLVGGWIPMLQVHRGGFLGKLLKKKGHSLDISLINFTAVSWQAGMDIGVQVLPLAFFVCFVGFVSVVAPLLELACLTWCAAEGRPAEGQRWYDRACWLHSFDAVDVLLAVVVVCVFEMEQIVNFHMGDQCAEFVDLIDNEIIMTLAGIGFAADPKCFAVEATLGPGWFVALVVVVLRSAAWQLLQPGKATAGAA